MEVVIGINNSKEKALTAHSFPKAPALTTIRTLFKDLFCARGEITLSTMSDAYEGVLSGDRLTQKIFDNTQHVPLLLLRQRMNFLLNIMFQI